MAKRRHDLTFDRSARANEIRDENLGIQGRDEMPKVKGMILNENMPTLADAPMRDPQGTGGSPRKPAGRPSG